MWKIYDDNNDDKQLKFLKVLSSALELLRIDQPISALQGLDCHISLVIISIVTEISDQPRIVVNIDSR